MGVAGVGQDVAEGNAGRGHAGQDGGERADRVQRAGGQGHPAGQLGHRRAVLLAGHGGCGQVVAVEHLASGAGQVAVAVPPVRLGVRAFRAAVPGRAGPAFHVGPVRCQRGRGVLVCGGDAGFEQVIADAGQVIGGGAVGLALAERLDDQAEGVPGLVVGELVRAGAPVLHHAKP